MDTKDYGVPQSRRRVYIVGVRDDAGDGAPFAFPQPVVPCRGVADFVERAPADGVAYERRGAQKDNAMALTPVLEGRGAVFVDVLQYRSVSRIPVRGFRYATCILCTSYVWCVPQRRWATERELLSLQGFPVNFQVPIPHHKFRRQIGNAMSVNVLEHIFAKLLHLPTPPVRGPYHTRV
jgi:DNA (cytosine-5)-methyltransferase 1